MATHYMLLRYLIETLFDDSLMLNLQNIYLGYWFMNFLVEEKELRIPVYNLEFLRQIHC